ncbi:MAG: exodeoxyribonuclease VII large subunit [Psychrobacter glaciei]|jgi:exodeoxyribonuclease VII large subunit
MQKTGSKPTVLSVSQLNRQSKELLETYLHNVQVSGEISNLSRPASGHWYFTLKDQRAQVRCAMFKSRTQYLKFVPKEGEQVLINASVGLYEARGDYQLIVNGMQSAGEGALKLAFEQLKARLYEEGLFNPDTKKPLPKHPRHLGVITSPTGAAIKDILSVLKRRFPNLPISIYPTQVQGEAAAAQISQAIERANRDKLCDVLIVGRGGGSLEDLWPFNEEIVARAIFNSQIPIISAVGHEVDVSISDYTADLRAATPSAAAELVSPDRVEWLGRFEQLERSLTRIMQNRLSQQRFNLLQLVKRLRHPKDKLQENMQRLDMAQMRLNNSLQRQLSSQQAHLTGLSHRLQSNKPDKQITQMKQTVLHLQQRMQHSLQLQLQDFKNRLARQAEVLNAVSPLSTLSRGYAIVTTESGKAVRTSSQVKVGDTVTAKLHQGSFSCSVDKIHKTKL